MTGRERVLATLNRRKPDVTAFDLGGTDCTSVHVISYQELRKCLGLADKPIRLACLGQLVAQTDRDVMDALEVDVEVLWFQSLEEKTWNTPFGPQLLVPKMFDVHDLPDGSSIVKTPGGQVWAQRASTAYYFDPGVYPLAQITSPRELAKFDSLFQRWDFSYVYDEPLETLAQRAKKQYASTQRAVTSLWRMHYAQAGQLMRGFEQFFLDLVENRDLVHAIMEKLHEVYLRRANTFLDAFGDWFDIVFLTDDLGTQQSGLFSPKMYREMIYPYISDLVGKIKARGKKIVMHSCGSVYDFIPSMIEMGIDALNPVQVSARNMNPRKLVGEFGRDIAFWGGGCDTQHALNASDPQVVRRDVRQRLEEYGPDAHLVFAQVHNIQYDVPPENILAMRDEFWQQARVGQGSPK
jgi:uroporphyrinogen decarboxylase